MEAITTNAILYRATIRGEAIKITPHPSYPGVWEQSRPRVAYNVSLGKLREWGRGELAGLHAGCWVEIHKQTWEGVEAIGFAMAFQKPKDASEDSGR